MGKGRFGVGGGRKKKKSALRRGEGVRRVQKGLRQSTAIALVWREVI